MHFDNLLLLFTVDIIRRIRNLSLEWNLTCKSKGAYDTGMYKLKVTFDTNTDVDNSLQFEYLPDPIISSTEPTNLTSINRYVT